MKNFKLLTLLAVLLCTVALATSCKEDPDWNPTWAIPVVKKTTLTVADFVDSSMTADFNKQIKQLWDNYVEEKTAELGVDAGDENIDSLAYFVMTDTALNYVEYDNTGKPQLTDSTKKELEQNGLNEEQIDQINDFLNDYFESGKIPNIPKKSVGARAVVAPKAIGGGKGVIDNLLDGITKNPVSIFPTVGSLINLMPGYKDSINAQLDSVLQKADMNDLVELDLKNIVEDANSVKRIEVNMEMNNTLPFKVSFTAEFVDAEGATIHVLLNDVLTSSESDETLEAVTIEAINTASTLANIVNKTTHMRLKVDMSKTEELTADHLRVLATKGITFTMRVRAQANMSKLID